MTVVGNALCLAVAEVKELAEIRMGLAVGWDRSWNVGGGSGCETS
jgi:hypothetical protein